MRLLLGAATPDAAQMVIPLAITMLFVGLLQGLGMWSLASRWSRTTVVYGVCGLAYWLTLLGCGTSLPALLKVMPVAAGVAFVVLLGSWLLALRGSSRAD